MTVNKIKVIKIVSISLIAVLILSACACGIYYVARSYNTSRGAINGGVTDGNGNDLESDKVFPCKTNESFDMSRNGNKSLLGFCPYDKSLFAPCGYNKSLFGLL